jgi:hypothetical protein
MRHVICYGIGCFITPSALRIGSGKGKRAFLARQRRPFVLVPADIEIARVVYIAAGYRKKDAN